MLDNTKINVCLACDNNYSKYTGVVIASILSNANPTDNLEFFILDGGISDEQKEKIYSLKSINDCNINFIKIDDSLFEDYKKIKTHAYITIATYYRLKLPSLLPNVDKIIYLDCDTIVTSSLIDLFNTDITDYAIAGILDIDKKMLKKSPKYFNAGVILMNLEFWRKQNLEKFIFNWGKENINNIKLGDQEILNEVLKNEVKIVSDEWNVQSSNFVNRSSYTNSPKIIHFVAKNKPWGGKSYSYHKNLYFKYLQLTPWKLSEEDLKKNLKSTALAYVKYRPLFLFRQRFYEALFETYIKPLFK